MKELSPALEAHYQQSSTSICTLLQLERLDGEMVGLTTLDAAIIWNDQMYWPGLELSSISTTETTSVDNLEFTMLSNNPLITDIDIESGLWDGCKFRLFEINFMDLSMGRNVIKRGTQGEAKLRKTNFTIEFRSMTQTLQQPQGQLTQKTCRVRFGSIGLGQCNAEVPEHELTILSVVSNREFTVASVPSGVEDDYYGEGTVKLLDGPNAALPAFKVKSFVGATFILSIPFPFTIYAGSIIRATAGCRHRFEEDCVGRWNNGPNFQGEPHLPGFDAVASLKDVE